MLVVYAAPRDTDPMGPIEASDPSIEDVYLTVEELADRWRIDPQTLYNQRSRGDGIPSTKLGGGVRYKVSDVLKAERDGQRGFSWKRLSNALDDFSDLTDKQREKLLKHLKKSFE